jgi:hypothetical protein
MIKHHILKKPPVFGPSITNGDRLEPHIFCIFPLSCNTDDFNAVRENTCTNLVLAKALFVGQTLLMLSIPVVSLPLVDGLQMKRSDAEESPTWLLTPLYQDYTILP